MALAAKHHGGPFNKQFKEYEQPWHIQKFEPVREWLNEMEPQYLKQKSAAEQNKYLALVAAVLQQASDDLFGANASEEDKKRMTKLPAKLFSSFEPNGGLCLIMECTFKYRIEMGWKLDAIEGVLLNKKEAGKHVELFLRIEKAVLNAGLLTRPRVFLSAGLSKEEKAQLKEIVQAHNGSLVNKREGASHEIIPADAPEDEEEADYCRSLETQDKMAKVHWWYYPDSYQEWKSLMEIDGDPEDPIPPPLVWKVSARFLKDLDKYNEWMNEDTTRLRQGRWGACRAAPCARSSPSSPSLPRPRLHLNSLPTPN